MGARRYDILFFRDSVDAYIKEATDDDSIEEYDDGEKYRWEHRVSFRDYFTSISKFLDVYFPPFT